MKINRLNHKIEDITLTTTSASQRIVSLDIIRGWFLIVILINHIELYPNGFDYFTGRGRLLVSAAEGFFFMSGLLVGMVYKRRLSNGFKFIFKKMWTRALELYLASIFLTLLFTAAAVFSNHETIKYGLFSVINWPHIIKETVLMRYGFGWADFLDRFAIMMFIAPFAFYMLSRGWWKLLLVISAIGWFAGQHQLTYNFTLTWQLLFNLAMVIGFYWQALAAKWLSLAATSRQKIKYGIVVTTAITFALSYASVYILSELNLKLLSLPPWLYNFTLHWNDINARVWLYSQKWTMGPVRLVLFMIWFSALFMFVQRYHGAINRYSRHLIELLGRNSLLVYIEHAFIVFAFKLFIPADSTFWVNGIITGSALACLFVVTVLYKANESHIAGVSAKIVATFKKPLLFLLPG